MNVDFSRSIPVLGGHDVVVVGGGTAGVTAALAAARAGADTALVERQAVVGGVTTGGRMASIGPRFLGPDGRLVVGGIPYELLEACGRAGGMPYPEPMQNLRGRIGTPFNIPFQPEVLAHVMLTRLRAAGVKLHLLTHFAHVLEPGPLPRGIVVVNKGGLGVLRAKTIVDCSGECDAAADAGAAVFRSIFTWGLLMRLGNVDFARTLAYVNTLRTWEPDPTFTPWLCATTGMTEAELRQVPHWRHILDPIDFGHAPVGDGHYGPEALAWINDRWARDSVCYNIELTVMRDLLRRAVDNGDLALVKDLGEGKMWVGWDGIAAGGWGPGVSLVNAVSAAAGFDGSNPRHVSLVEAEGRILAMELFRFFRAYVPGYEGSFLIDTGNSVACRSSRMIDGMRRGTPEGIDGPEVRDDETIYLFPGSGPDGVRVTRIPYGVMVPRGVDNILVAGKCASGARYFRSIASCLAMGQAAGAAAAHMAATGRANRDVDAAELQRTLRAQGVILDPGESSRAEAR